MTFFWVVHGFLNGDFKIAWANNQLVSILVTFTKKLKYSWIFR